MSNTVANINLEEAMNIIEKNKNEILELKLRLKNKEEEIEELKKIISEMKEHKLNKEEYDECAFDGLFESYNYYKQEN